MKVNGAAVYGAKPTAFDGPGVLTQEYLTKKDNAEKRSKKLGHKIHVSEEMAYEWLATSQDGNIYISMFEWLGESFTLDSFEGKIKDAYFL